jgi:hypothetical protein
MAARKFGETLDRKTALPVIVEDRPDALITDLSHHSSALWRDVDVDSN